MRFSFMNDSGSVSATDSIGGMELVDRGRSVISSSGLLQIALVYIYICMRLRKS